MKVVTFVYEDKTRLGALRSGPDGERVFDLNQLDQRLPADMLSFLEAGKEAQTLARQVVDAAPPSSLSFDVAPLNMPIKI